MNYQELIQLLQKAGYSRIEKDDRLLDIFPTDTRRYGIELWEKWTSHTINILRLHLPFNIKKTQLFSISRQEIEQDLKNNTSIKLSDITPKTKGPETLNSL